MATKRTLHLKKLRDGVTIIKPSRAMPHVGAMACDLFGLEKKVVLDTIFKSIKSGLF